MVAVNGPPGPRWCGGFTMRRLLVAVLIAASLAACSPGTKPAPFGSGDVPQGNASDPLVAHGRVVDSTGKPLAGITVFLVMDPSQSEQASMQPGDTLRQTTLIWTQSDAKGAFEIHLKPTESVRATSADNGGFINFEVNAFDPYPPAANGKFGMWGFPLTLSGNTFAGLPDPITLTLQ